MFVSLYSLPTLLIQKQNNCSNITFYVKTSSIPYILIPSGIFGASMLYIFNASDTNPVQIHNIFCLEHKIFSILNILVTAVFRRHPLIVINQDGKIGQIGRKIRSTRFCLYQNILDCNHKAILGTLIQQIQHTKENVHYMKMDRLYNNNNIYSLHWRIRGSIKVLGFMSRLA